MSTKTAMSHEVRQAKNRRRFLKFLAASPLATPAFLEAWQQAMPDIKTAKDAFSVMDFETIAKRVLPVAHYGYMASGVDDDLTLRANVEAYKKIQLRPHRLAGVTNPEIKAQLFGSNFDIPIFICPTGGQRMFHPDGEVATARAAKAKNALQILSTVTSISYEEVSKARTQPVWYQLYAPAKWEDDERLIKRVEDAGCPVLALTIDLLGGRNTETFRRARRADTRDCSACHVGEPGTRLDDRPMFKGIEARINPSFLDWTFVDKVKKNTKMKFILKGIESGEDAKLAVEHGVDGILVSNHGGRAAETLRGTIETLPEVVDAVRGRVPVFVDGGIRRGTDVYKALALGATAVGIGRPYLWGLAAFGQEGVEQVLDILRVEFAMTMRQMGAPSIAKIDKSSVILR
jgi:4-hydroxymandelate oxidase